MRRVNGFPTSSGFAQRCSRPQVLFTSELITIAVSGLENGLNRVGHGGRNAPDPGGQAEARVEVECLVVLVVALHQVAAAEVDGEAGPI